MEFVFYTVSHITLNTHSDHLPGDLETTCVEIVLLKSTLMILALAIYRFQKQLNILSILEHLCNCYLYSIEHETFILCDFNIDVCKKRHWPTSALNSFFNSYVLFETDNS
jgi:hypothetical protein